MTKTADIHERYRMVMDPECPAVVAKFGARGWDWQDLSSPVREPGGWWERAHCFECEQCMRFSRAAGLLWDRTQREP